FISKQIAAIEMAPNVAGVVLRLGRRAGRAKVRPFQERLLSVVIGLPILLAQRLMVHGDRPFRLFGCRYPTSSRAGATAPGSATPPRFHCRARQAPDISRLIGNARSPVTPRGYPGD